MDRRAVGTKIPDYFREVAVRSGSTAYDAFFASGMAWTKIQIRTLDWQVAA